MLSIGDGGAGGGVVSLTVTHSQLQRTFAEIKFCLASTVAQVKSQLYQITGTAPGSMALELRSAAGDTICALASSERPLGYYSPVSGQLLHVTDTDPASLSSQGWLDDTSKVEKYEISEAAYNDRQDTFRKFKQRLQQQQQPPGSPEAATADDLDPNDDKENCHASVGDRCRVQPGERRGVVKFVGAVPSLAPGLWVGVQFDEPLGKNDGALGDRRYFECPMGHGSFTRASKVEVGNFPAVSDFSDDEL